MALFRRSSAGRSALVFMLIALLMLVCVAVYLALARLLHPASIGASPNDTALALRGKLTILLAIVLGAILLILAFALGAYLVLRIGRSLAQRRVGGHATEYVDAWSHYRLSAAQIDAATRDEHGPSRPDEPGGAADTRPDTPPGPDPERN